MGREDGVGEVEVTLSEREKSLTAGAAYNKNVCSFLGFSFGSFDFVRLMTSTFQRDTLSILLFTSS